MKPQAFRILVTLDGSRESESVLDSLAPLFRTLPVEVTLMCVAAEVARYPDARAYLDGVVKTLGEREVRSRTRIGIGPVVSEILPVLDPKRFDLLAMTSHGLDGLDRIFWGSVVESVLRQADIPMLITRPGTPIRGWERMIVAHDGSNRAGEILPDAVPLARALDSTLDIVWVRQLLDYAVSGGEADWLHVAARRAEAEGVRASTHILDGSVPEELCRYADASGAGLICMTTHGRTGLKRVLLGSVADRVIRSAPCPVLVRRCSNLNEQTRTVRTQIRAGEPLN